MYNIDLFMIDSLIYSRKIKYLLNVFVNLKHIANTFLNKYYFLLFLQFFLDETSFIFQALLFKRLT